MALDDTAKDQLAADLKAEVDALTPEELADTENIWRVIADVLYENIKANAVIDGDEIT